MISRNYFIFWSAACVLFLLFVWAFKAVLLPFVIGIIVAYLLNPMVNKLGSIGIPRQPATITILGGFLLLVTGFLVIISPILYRELAELARDIPGYADKIWALVKPYSAMIQGYLGHEEGTDIQTVIKDNAGTAAKVANALLGSLAAGGQLIIGIGTVLVVMPIVAYFMMIEWPSITTWATNLMPVYSRDTILDLLKKIDRKIAGFIRGQISVASFLGIFYALALALVGLKYGFLIGLGAGIISVIPMVGSAVGLIVSVGVALFQWLPEDQWLNIGLVAAIFIGGQLFEGNYLTPKLVGDSVGLHPLWVFFALMAGGSLFGILGMFLAVPVAAVIGVLVSYGIERYKGSYYYDHENPSPQQKKQHG